MGHDKTARHRVLAIAVPNLESQRTIPQTGK